MIRATPEGDIASHYDPMLWRQLDPLLRAARLKQLQDIAAFRLSLEDTRFQQGVLRGLDIVREMANEAMRIREDPA